MGDPGAEVIVEAGEPVRDEWFEGLLARRGPQWVVRSLAPWATDRRVGRLRGILDQRLTSPVVVLVRLYDPHNGAAVARTVEAMGLQDLYVAEPADPGRLLAPKVSIGAEKWLTVHRFDEFPACAEALARRGFELWAAVPGAETPLSGLPLDRPVALVFGNERDGLTERDVEACHGAFSLPMWGFTQSYNLSVSVGITLGHLVPGRRDRLGGLGGELPDARKQELLARWLKASVRASRQLLAKADGAEEEGA